MRFGNEGSFTCRGAACRRPCAALVTQKKVDYLHSGLEGSSCSCFQVGSFSLSLSLYFVIRLFVDLFFICTSIYK